MSRKYKFHNPEGVYFVSFAVEGWGFRAEDYVYSSAINYAGEKGLLDVTVVD